MRPRRSSVDPNPTLIELDQDRSSLSILGTLVGLVLLTYLLYYVGALGSIVTALGQLVRWSIRGGFRAWEVCFSWASWLVHLVVAVGLIALGVACVHLAPGLSLLCAGAAIL